MKTSNPVMPAHSENEVSEIVEQPHYKITRKDLFKAFLRSFTMEFSWNYERQMNLSFAFVMIPILKKLYPNKKDLSCALKRHLEFFNTTPFIVTLITGISAAMEEQNANDKSFDTNAINNIKASLMGSIAGIGDSFFWGTLRLIATGIGTSLALQGNILGPILFVLIFNIPSIALRFLCNKWGYQLGTGFLQKLQASGMMGRLTFGAAILGLMVIGGMSSSMITVHMPLLIGTGKNAPTLQDIFNQIMPNLLPLIAFGVIYWLLGKDTKPLTILIGIAVVGIAGAGFGILGV